MAESCSNCRYYFTEVGATVCRRNPPLPFIIPASMLQAATVMPVWPNPHPENWCGEWRSPEGGTVLTFPQRDPGDENPSGGIK